MADDETTLRRRRLAAAFGTLAFPANSRSDVFLRFGLQSLSSVNMVGSGVPPRRLRPKSSKGGRPINARAKAVTILTAYTYQMLTGKPPTLKVPMDSMDNKPVGAYFELLREVFAILGLKENPEHFAKSVRKGWGSSAPKRRKWRSKQVRFPPLDNAIGFFQSGVRWTTGERHATTRKIAPQSPADDQPPLGRPAPGPSESSQT